MTLMMMMVLLVLVAVGGVDLSSPQFLWRSTLVTATSFVHIVESLCPRLQVREPADG